jgi:hypothetical protein
VTVEWIAGKARGVRADPEVLWLSAEETARHRPRRPFATDLDVRMPNATLSGTMHLTASLPEGSLDLRLSTTGPVMYNGGTGLIPFLGSSTYH